MSMNRRNLFRAAGALAGAGLIPAGEALAAPKKAAKAAPALEAGVRTLKGGVTVGAPPPVSPNSNSRARSSPVSLFSTTASS